MFHRLLICTDLTDGLQRLTQCVPQFATIGVKQLVFLHGVPLRQESDIPREDSAQIESVRLQLQDSLVTVTGVETAVRVATGSSVQLIRETLGDSQSDLVVVGSSIRSLLTQKLFGSTLAALTQELKTPLLTIRPPLLQTMLPEELALRCTLLWRTLLIPYDGSASAQFTVQQVCDRLAQGDQMPDRQPRCVLLWVVDPGIRGGVDDAIQTAQGAIAVARTQLESLGMEVVTEVRQGEGSAEIMKAAMQYGASAIAISSRKANRLVEWSVPSMAGDLMRQAWHPVLFFPQA